MAGHPLRQMADDLFVKKPIPVRARLVTTSEVVLTAHGRVRAEPGDYVLTDPANDDTWPIKPDIFAANYTPYQVEEKK